MIVVNIHTGNNISAMNSGQGTLDMWKAQKDLPVLRVSELSVIIKELFQDERLLDVLVEGEVTNYKHHSRGNRYFSLSEENGKESAVIKCMMWSSDAGKLPFVPEDGMRVIARGRIDFYPPGGNCQLYVKSMSIAGAGEKYLLVERWKQELSLEGCFAPERKQPLPLYPSVIGVVTSGTGAILQDIKNVIRRRYPLRIILSPTAVQGEGAHLEIAAAIRKIDGTVDVIIVARGGGSFEDLFPFNHPEVVRAIASCSTPVISAVGHEVDTTLADYAADARAPTPSAAAEMAVPDRTALLAALREYRCAMGDALGNQLERAFDELATLRERIHPKKLGYRIIERRQNIDDMADRVLLATMGKISGGRLRLNEVRAIIDGKNPLNILSRGYCVVEKTGKVVRSARSLAPGDDLVLRLTDGKSRVMVREVTYDKEI